MGATSSWSFVGPRRIPADAAFVPQQWIVRLAPDATAQLESIVAADVMLDSEYVNFDVIRGLGLPGMLLVESYASPTVSVASWLASNPWVSDFGLNDEVRGAQIPDDPLFAAMTNLNSDGQNGALPDADIDAPQAWDVTTGAASTVVGVIDSGVDVTHEDLFLNIWLNQGEIPSDLASQLSDLDGDGLITFWDLNNLRVVESQIYVASTVQVDLAGNLLAGDLATIQQATTATPFAGGGNGPFVNDVNGNGRIDAIDLLGDSTWSDGGDTDGNGFVDDLFGWNFRNGSVDESFAANNPSDSFGHGTHIAGTIGAVGNNGVGIAGINWQSSIMPIKFLDARNQGTQADAIAAINYATLMRQQYGVSIRVTNNSWETPGSLNPLLDAAIQAASDAGILYVTAAGNGDSLGQGIDLDNSPGYPSNLVAPNVISVAATDLQDRLAAFSNFGSHTVDVAAPGVGVVSTLPGGRYDTGNGTSMAAAHVSGVAALLWTVHPSATIDEIRTAILAASDVQPDLVDRIASGGRLNAIQTLQSEVLPPQAILVSVDDVSSPGGTLQEIVVQYRNQNGIDVSSLGDDDLLISHRWGLREEITATLVPNSVVALPDGKTVQASYEFAPPGGVWDAADFGRYEIEVRPASVASNSGRSATSPHVFGSFVVRIDSPDVFYVTSSSDRVDANVGDGDCADATGTCSLRAAIQEANALATPVTIILEVGEARVDIAHAADPSSTFPDVTSIDGLPSVPNNTGWSNETSGDLDILGNISIVGDHAELSQIVGSGVDRLFKVHPGASLSLQRLTIRGGVAPADQGGGAILSAGIVRLDQVIVTDNVSLNASTGLGGGGIALWGGELEIHQSTIAGNAAEIGGGLLASNRATGNITRSTFVGNVATVGDGLENPDPELIGGGGIVAIKSGEINVENSTFSANSALNAAGAAIGVFSLAPRVVVSSSDVPKAIPDTTTITSQLVVSDFDDVLSDVNVRLSIDHTFNGDLDVFLVSPTGTRVELFTGVGASSNNFTDTLLDDEALVAIGSGSAPFTGAFRPEGRLSDLIGEDPNGIWLLEVQDTTVNDIGTLIQWSLDLEPFEGSWARANLNHVTAALHEGASTVAGRVRLHSTLLAGNSGVPVAAGVTDLGFNLVTDANAIAPLTDMDQLAKVHPLQAGSTAIDAADPADYPSQDQLGSERPRRGGDFLTLPDVGAVEMVGGSIAGQVFLDRNGDANRDIDEVGLPGFLLFVDVNGNGQLDPGEPQSPSSGGDQAGNFLLDDLLVGSNRVYLQVPEGWFVTDQPTLVNVRFSENDGNHHSPSLSFDGNTVAFYSEFIPDTGPAQNRLRVLNRSAGTYYSPTFVDEFGFPPTEIPYDAFDAPSISANGNYVSFLHTFDLPFIPGPHDSVEVVDVRLADELTPGFSVASELTGFVPSDGAISEDGRYVVFTSESDIYLFDRQLDEIELVSIGLNGADANGPSQNATVSGDGQFVVFESAATNLVDNDINNRIDVFVLDRVSGEVQRINIADNQSQANEDAVQSSISGNGRFVVFASSASNLVLDDDNEAFDIFVFDRQAQTIESIVLSINGGRGNGDSLNPAISSDGRFVVFESSASNLVSDDTNESSDVFVFDRATNTTHRVAESSHSPAISGDGKFLAYVQGSETFVASNPLAPVANRTVILNAGDTAVAPSFGLSPASGEIRGVVFEDLLENGRRDVADPGLEGWSVYLDVSGNGQFDPGEPQTLTDIDGRYGFADVPGFADYTVRVEVPAAWRQVLPDPAISDAREVFVDAGQTVENLEFGLVRDTTGEPQQNASIEGTVFTDKNRDGILGVGESGIADVTVFLDLNDDGLQQAEEPVSITNAAGTYSFSGLGSRTFTVRAVIAEDSRLSAPRGNVFTADSLPERTATAALGGLRDTMLVDLNGDTYLDLVSLLYDANRLSIRLNDGNGSWSDLPRTIGISPESSGPIAVAAGNLNQQGSTDLVVVHQLSGTATVLYDFDGMEFDSIATYAVGPEPSDVLIGDFDGMHGLDFVVSNSSSHTLTVMHQDAAGAFAPTVVDSGGKRPVSVAAGDFNGDNKMDLAVANYGDHPSGGDLGAVAVLINQGAGNFADAVPYQAGFGPAGIAVADLNGDGRDDLAVASFLSSSLTVLLGRDDGLFDLSPQLLALGEVPIPVDHPIHVVASDIDLDGDQDLLLSGATDPLGFIVRNDLSRNDLSGGSFALFPAEAIPVSGTLAEEPSRIAVGDIDKDGIVDLVLAGRSAEKILVLRNQIADGAFRLALSGTETVTGLNFGIRSALIEAIILEGAGETVDMAALDAALRASVKLIDIRGTGSNTLILDATTIQNETPNQTLRAIADADDQVVFDNGWRFSRVETVDGQFERIFVNGSATLRLIGPRSWTNPINATDVNGNGEGTAADALAIINALAPRLVVDAQDNLVDPTTIDPSRFRFYDVNRDGRMTASDALFVINRIGRAQVTGQGELVDEDVFPFTTDLLVESAANWLAARSAPQGDLLDAEDIDAAIASLF